MIKESHDSNMAVQNNFFSSLFQPSAEYTFKESTSIISGQTSVDVIMI